MDNNNNNESYREYLRILISSSNNASIRSRVTYFILSLTCLLVLIGIYNMDYSWERHLNFNERKFIGFGQDLYPQDSVTKLLLDGKIGLDKADDKSKIIFEKYIENMSNNFTSELFKRYEIHIPVLGIRIFSSDLSVLASLGIVMVLTWLFFSIRREYHIVNRIKREFNQAYGDVSVRKLIFFGAAYENVFTTATKRNINLTLARKSKIRKFIAKTISPQYVMFILKFLPVATILMTIYSDLNTVSRSILEHHKVEIILREGFAFLALCYCSYVTIHIYKLDRNIEINLSYMNKKIN